MNPYIAWCAPWLRVYSLVVRSHSQLQTQMPHICIYLWIHISLGVHPGQHHLVCDITEHVVWWQWNGQAHTRSQVWFRTGAVFLFCCLLFSFCFVFSSYCSFVLFLSISVINLYIFFPTALNISLFSYCLPFLQSAAIYVFVVRYRVGTGIDFI